MEPTVLPTLALGFLLGMEHALDADHVVAVSTMVSQQRSLRRASLIGIIWGLGHTATLFLVGVAVILLKIRIPGRIALSMEFLVGIVLVALGVFVVRGHLAGKVHVHTHRHAEQAHFHFHSHAGGEDHEHPHPLPRHRRTLLVGMIHGLAGSAALMLLVLATIRTPGLGLLYILLFGAGSLLGMLGVTTLLGLPFVLTLGRFANLHQRMRLTVGATSVAYGVWIMAQVGIREGLFR